MRFEDALKAMRDGKPIRRKSWIKQSYIYIEDIDRSAKLNASELMADDWEIVEEKQAQKAECVCDVCEKNYRMNSINSISFSGVGAVQINNILHIGVISEFMDWHGRKIKVTVETID